MVNYSDVDVVVEKVLRHYSSQLVDENYSLKLALGAARDLDACDLYDAAVADEELSEEEHHVDHHHGLKHHCFRAYVEMYIEIIAFVYTDQAL